MSAPAPIAYTPQDRLKLLQNQVLVGTGTPRQLNFSTNFRIVENDLDNYYSIDVGSLSTPYVSGIQDTGITGIPIIDSISSNTVFLRSVMAASNQIAVTLDVANKAVAIDVVTAEIELDSLGNVTISTPQNNDFLVWNSVLGKWRNLPFLPLAWANLDKSGSMISDLSDVVTGSLSDNDVMVWSSSVSQWRNLSVLPWTSVNKQGSVLDDISDVVITSPQANQVLAWNSSDSQWKNIALVLDSLGNVNISGIADKQVLTYDVASTKWINAAVPPVADIDNITNVTIATPLNGDVLTYETASTSWKNKTPGALTIAHLDDIGDVTITTPANAQVLTYDSANAIWKNASPGALTIAHLDDVGDVTITSPLNTQGLLYDTASTSWKNATLSLSTLSNVLISAPVNNNDVLTYESSSFFWKNKPPGALTVSKLDDIGDVTVTTPLNTQALLYDTASTGWKNSTLSISTLSNVLITSPLNGDHLVYETASFMWKNKPPSATSVAHLDDVGDVTITTAADNQVLMYEASTTSWKNKLVPSPLLQNIGTVSISSPLNNQVLTYETATSVWKNKTPTVTAYYTETGMFMGGMMPDASTQYGAGLGQLFVALTVTTATGADIYAAGQDQVGGNFTKISTTTTNHSVGVIKTPTVITQRKYNPVFTVRAAPVDTPTRRYFFGLASVASLPTNTDTVLANASIGVLIGYRAGTDSNWKIFNNDGLGAMNVVDTGVAVSGGSPITVCLVLNDTVPKIQWSVNNSAFADITTKVPPQVTGLYCFLAHVETTTTNDRSVIMYYSNLYHTRY